MQATKRGHSGQNRVILGHLQVGGAIQDALEPGNWKDIQQDPAPQRPSGYVSALGKFNGTVDNCNVEYEGTEMNRESFAADLRRWREIKGLSQSKAANHLSISVRTLQSWEVRARTPAPLTHRLLMEKIEADLKRQ